jgi:hypothetical protein
MKWFKTNKNLSKREQQVKGIIEGYMDQYGTNPSIDAIVAPQHDMDNYIILDRENEIYISIDHHDITISNHAFLYEKQFRLEYVESLKKGVRKKIAAEREKLKQELFKNERELLERISSKAITCDKTDINLEKVT